MKLSFFLVGMFVAACLAAGLSYAMGGTLLSAGMIWLATLVLAQVLYLAMLVAMARFTKDDFCDVGSEGNSEPFFGRKGKQTVKSASRGNA